MKKRRTAISAISFEENKLLIVKKQETWILPGGKPKPNETNDIDCLLRECGEELPDAVFVVKNKYRDFTGKTPNKGDMLTVKAYFAEVSGSIKPSAEISESKFVSKQEIAKLPLSDITNKIVNSLIKDKIFF